MSPESVGIIGVAVMLILIFMRVWVGAAMIFVGFLGLTLLDGWDKAFIFVGTEPYSQIAFYIISCIPLFILMGIVVSRTGIAGDLFNAANKWIGNRPGGLAMGTMVATGGFAAVCGDSIATAAAMGKVAYPEMKKLGYDSGLAAGCIAAGGSIGILIPPSLGFILYGLLCEQSIGKLFMAGFIPGVLEVVAYSITIFILCRMNPKLGPPGPRTTLREKVSSLKSVWAMVALFVVVLGGIYLGIFTPTEAGAVGAFGAIVIALIGRRLTRTNFRETMVETAKITAMIVLLITGAFVFLRFLAISGLPTMLSEFVVGLEVPKFVFLIGIIIFYLILGCFWDIFACILLTLPFIFPVIVALEFNPIWFGVIMVRCMEVGLITPPFGLNVFVLSGVIDVPPGTVFRGVLPFVIADFCLIALLCTVPALSLWLPSTM
ncbi:C4-dicarboxylate TRAP transporter large permease protein DctM [subsurface metagenome]